MTLPNLSRSSMVSSLLQLWRFAPRRMRQAVLKGFVFRMLQACCLGGVFGMISLWSYAFATGTATSSPAIGATCLALLLLVLLQFLFAYLSVGCIWLTSFRLVGAIRHRLLRHLTDLPMTFHLSQPKGDLANALTSDLSLVENLLTEGLPRLAHALSLPLFVLLIICIIDPVTAVIAILPILTALPLLLLSCRHLARLSTVKQRAQADATSQVLQWVEAMATVRTFGMFESRRDAYHSPLLEIYRISVQMVARLTAPLLGFSALIVSGLAVVVAVTGYRHEVGALSTGQATAILVLSLPLYTPLLGLAPFMELAAVAQGAVGRLNTIMLAKKVSAAKGPAPSGHAVTCEGVGFRYSHRRPTLNPVTIQMPEHGLTAIVGRSGAGKSTFLQLIAGLLHPTEGRISIGGVDVRDIRSADLNRLISVVFQDVALFQGSVLDNIAMGDPNATREEIEIAAKAASAHAFIEALPEGYETLVGESGLRLSGGERQRLSLARAVLRKSPILLIDEGTASVDSLAAHEIASALKALARDRSVVVVTHSLSTLEGVDQVVELC